MFDFIRRKMRKRELQQQPLDPHWLQDAVDESSHTPDIKKIELQPWRLLFVYDEFQPGHPFHELIEDYVHPDPRTHVSAFTVDRFTVWKRDMKSYTFPVPLERRFHGMPLARVRGIVYPIRPNRLKQLDIIRQNGVQFIRKRVHLVYPIRKVMMDENGDVTGHFLERERIRADMYIGVDEYFNEMLDCMVSAYSPVRYFETKFIVDESLRYPESVQYYQFTTQEYEP